MPNQSKKSDHQRFTEYGNTIGIYIYIDFAQLVPQRKRKQKRKKEERMLNKMHNART